MRSVSPADGRGWAEKFRRAERSRRAEERGSVTAEFATAMPAVILVLALCLAAGQLVSRQLSLQDAAAAAARSVSRGGSVFAVDRRIREIAPAAGVSRSDRDGLSCITISAPAAVGPAQLTLNATSCALSEPGW